MSDTRSRSWFCVWNNPDRIITYEHAPDGSILTDDDGNKVVLSNVPDPAFAGLSDDEICVKALNVWTSSRQGRTGAVVLCESAKGLRHFHLVLESKNACSFSVVKKLFPKLHAESTKGTKQDVEDYINKVGKFEEKGEKILARSQVGDIVGCQGARTDLVNPDLIHTLLYEKGMTPQQVLDEFPNAYKQKGVLNDMYYRKRFTETPIQRDVSVTWLVGSTATGKSYKYVELCEKFGEDNVYKVTDYSAPFDSYNGQPVLFLEEYRGAFALSQLLILLDVYKADIHARYNNKVGLWNEVYITSPCLPYELYTKYNDTSSGYDRLEQLYRRIDSIVFCSKVDTPAHVYYFRSVYPCELRGTADDYRARFDDDIRTYKSLISLGQAQSISDCVYIKNIANTD